MKEKDHHRVGAGPGQSTPGEPGPYEDFFTAQREIGLLYRLTMDSLLAAEGLTPPQFIAVSELRRLGRASKISELGRMVFMSPAVMTGMVDRLIRRRLVRRNFDDRDRRVILLTLTERGSAALSRIDERLREVARRFERRISTSERTVTLRVLRRYADFLHERLDARKTTRPPAAG